MTTLPLTINILDIDDFKVGFLKSRPKPPAMAHLTDLQYLKQIMEEFLFHWYKEGKIQIAQETTPPTVNENIVEVA